MGALPRLCYPLVNDASSPQRARQLKDLLAKLKQDLKIAIGNKDAEQIRGLRDTIEQYEYELNERGDYN